MIHNGASVCSFMFQSHPTELRPDCSRGKEVRQVLSQISSIATPFSALPANSYSALPWQSAKTDTVVSGRVLASQKMSSWRKKLYEGILGLSCLVTSIMDDVGAFYRCHYLSRLKFQITALDLMSCRGCHVSVWAVIPLQSLEKNRYAKGQI